MKLLYGHSRAVAKFVSENVPGCERGFSNNVAIGVLDGEKLIAGVVYHNWNPEAEVIELSSASIDPRWMHRSVMTGLLGYPFDGLKCQMVVARIAPANVKARRLWKALGAKEYIIPRLRGRDEAETIQTLTAEAWAASKFKR